MIELNTGPSCFCVLQIYVCGGNNGTEFLQTVECYDPDTNQWTVLAPMTTRRKGLSVVAYANQIYAVSVSSGLYLSDSQFFFINHSHIYPHISVYCCRAISSLISYLSHRLEDLMERSISAALRLTTRTLTTGGRWPR